MVVFTGSSERPTSASPIRTTPHPEALIPGLGTADSPDPTALGDPTPVPQLGPGPTWQGLAWPPPCTAGWRGSVARGQGAEGAWRGLAGERWIVRLLRAPRRATAGSGCEQLGAGVFLRHWPLGLGEYPGILRGGQGTAGPPLLPLHLSGLSRMVEGACGGGGAEFTRLERR